MEYIQQQLESTEDCEQEAYSTPENDTQQPSASTEDSVVRERVKNADGDSRYDHVISERKKKEKNLTHKKEYACLSMLGAGIAIGGALFDSGKATAIGTAVAIIGAVACRLEEDD